MTGMSWKRPSSSCRRGRSPRQKPLPRTSTVLWSRWGKPVSESSSPSSQEETAPRVSHMAGETGKSLGKQLQQRLREADDAFHQLAQLNGHCNFHQIFKTTSALPLFHTQDPPPLVDALHIVQPDGITQQFPFRNQ